MLAMRYQKLPPSARQCKLSGDTYIKDDAWDENHKSQSMKELAPFVQPKERHPPIGDIHQIACDIREPNDSRWRRSSTPITFNTCW